MFGVELELLKGSLDQAVSERKVEVSEGDKWSALERARHILPVIQGAKILWVDDYPQGNWQLVKILFGLGADVDQASHTDQALSMLGRDRYDVIVSDIRRTEGDPDGIEMLRMMQDLKIARPTIFYVSVVLPKLIEGAFNITNRPDQLLHLIMDALERERWTGLGDTAI
jgi:CheY-like chemotaxis protein